jgi:hypothetical protein
MRTVLAMAILLLSGCATYTGVGSEKWHAERLSELQVAYEKGEIEASEYFKLRNEIDAIRQDHDRPRRNYPSYHFGYGYHHKR